MADYVICRPESDNPEDLCPITSLAFSVDKNDPSFDQWEFISAFDDSAESEDKKDVEMTEGIYISRKVLQHGI